MTTRKEQFWQRYKLLLILLLVLLTLAMQMTYGLYQSREQILQDATLRLENQSHVLHQDLKRQLISIDQVLRHMRNHFSHDDLVPTEKSDVTQQLGVMVDVLESVRTLIVFDAEGIAVASNRSELIGRDFSKREYFQHALNNPQQDQLYVAPPFLTVLGVYSLNLVLPRYGPQREFAGIVTATLDVDVLGALMVSMGAGGDTRLLIIHGDGLLLNFAPEHQSVSPGINMNRPGTIFSKHLASGLRANLIEAPSKNFKTQTLASIRTLQTTEPLMQGSLVVSASRELDSILAEWTERFQNTLLVFLLVALFAIAGVMRYQQRSRRHQYELDKKEEERLRVTQTLQRFIDQLPGLAYVKDADSHFLMANRRYHDIHGMDPESMLGKTNHDLFPDEFADRITADDQHALESDVTEMSLQNYNGRDFETRKFVIDAGNGKRQLGGVSIDITERKRSEEALRQSEETFRKLFEGSADPILLINSNGIFVECNQAALDLLKMTRAQFLLLSPAKISPEFQPDGRRSEESAQEMILLAYRKGLHRFDWTCINAEGSELIVEVSLMPLIIKGETMLHTAWRDVTERKHTEKVIKQLNTDLESRQAGLQLAASVFTHAREGITITDVDATIIDVNEAFTRITGYSREEVVGQNPRLLQSGHQSKEFYVEMWKTLIDEGHWDGELWNRRKNGEVYAEMISISAIRDNEGITQRYVALFSDITPMKDQQRKLEHIAHFDALTSLPNRALLADRMEQAMAQCLRRDKSLAVVFLDLDGFKAVNDTHGHDIGDSLLISASLRMRVALRDGDTLSRLGGDEFVAILTDLDQPNDCVPVLERLLSATTKPFNLGEVTTQVSASIGVTFYPHDGDDADLLLRHADQAMYQAKQAGKNRYHIFDAEQDRDVRSRHESIQRISEALINREFVLYYQPKINMNSGAMIGVEALIRWQHPERGLLPPAAFLPDIENHELSVELGEWVIDTALSQLGVWQEQGLETSVSVNIAAIHLLQKDFVERLGLLLEAHPNIHPQRLELEILETSAIDDIGHVSEVMTMCKDLGVSFSLDDFGTGYSSLTYLKQLPARELKIDQSFVRNMLDDPEDLAILDGVLGLAASFDRSTIAEGVETVEHGVVLLQLGCELAQGYVIARPMPAAELPSWHQGWRPDPLWTQTHQLSRSLLPVIFAGSEHQAWISRLDSFLEGNPIAPPPMDHHQCRFGRWLEGNGCQYHDTHGAVFSSIDALHSQIHALANELMNLQRQGRGAEARDGLSELHSLRDRLLAELRHLLV